MVKRTASDTSGDLYLRAPNTPARPPGRWQTGPPLWAIAALLVLGLAATGCSDGPVCGDFPLEAENRRCIINTVDGMVQRNYPFDELRDIDLQKFSDDLHALEQQDELGDLGFLRAVERRVARLKDGHTTLDWADPGMQGYPPFRARFIDGRAVVTRVYEGAEAYLDRGMEITRIDDQPVGELYDKRVARIEASAELTRRRLASFRLVAGPIGSTLSVELAAGRTLDFPRKSPSVGRNSRPRTRRFGDIGYMAIPNFRHIDDIDEFDRLLDQLMDTEALILDLRANGGGTSTAPDAYLGRFIDKPLPVFKLVDIAGNVEHRVQPFPRGRQYDGELYVLTGPFTYSAANYFVQRLKRQDRATVVGRPTGGGAASPVKKTVLVPGVHFRVSTLVVRPPDAPPSETGIAPDVRVPVDVEHVQSTPPLVRGNPETDPDLRRALQMARQPSEENDS